MPKHYTEAERKQALLALALTVDLHGTPNYIAVAKTLGMARSNLHRWWQEEQAGHTSLLEGEDLEELRRTHWNVVKNNLLSTMQETATAGANRLRREIETLPPRKARDLSIAVATLIDKASHLANDPIGRYAHQHTHQVKGLIAHAHVIPKLTDDQYQDLIARLQARQREISRSLPSSAEGEGAED